ncbi:MAG: trypsin-like serine protease [Ruminococcaceae bacterium]|nr:trypsin-like serine protease [Oscillospiraceae bacterium]
MVNTKRVFLSIITALLIPVMVYAHTDVKVYVNGIRLKENVILENDRTYVPLRAVSETMGATVTWDDSSKSAYISFSEDDAIAKIVENSSPGVVTIVGNYQSTREEDSYNNFTTHGSGVVYKSSGYIVTNAHVVKDIKNLTVVFSDGTLLPGKVLCSDELADIAIVKVDKVGLSPISFADKNSIMSGKTAIAIGTPISLSMRNTVTKGIVCGNGVSLKDSHYKLIQTDTTVNPGNSGGPLLNTKGELIGITSSKYVSMSIDNVAFAIPVDTVEYVIKQYEEYGSVKRASFQFELEPSWEAKIGLPTQKGLTIRNSKDQILHDGDVVVSVNGIDVHSITDWNEAMKNTYNGQPLLVKYYRNGELLESEING